MPQLDRPVYVDHEMWEKIVLNLLSNAFKFTLEVGIVVTLKAAGEAADVTVRDSGSGIAAEVAPSLSVLSAKGSPGRMSYEFQYRPRRWQAVESSRPKVRRLKATRPGGATHVLLSHSGVRTCRLIASAAGPRLPRQPARLLSSRRRCSGFQARKTLPRPRTGRDSSRRRYLHAC